MRQVIERVVETAIMLTVCLLATQATAQPIDITEAAVLGEPHAEDQVRTAGADRIGALSWVSETALIVSGDNGRDFFEDEDERFVYRLDAATGERFWEQRFVGRHGSIDVSRDRRLIVVQLDEREGAAERGPAVLARVLDAESGETEADIMQRDVGRGLRRRETSPVDALSFGQSAGELLVVFRESKEDVDRAGRAGGVRDSAYVHGERAYRYLWRDREWAWWAFEMDPEARAFALSPDGTLLGYVAGEDLLCVYDAEDERDRVLAGEHRTEPDDGWGALDAPFYSGIQISNTHAVVARDAPGGPASALLFVINLTNGQVEARIETPGGHIVFDTDFENERIAVTGSAKHLGIYDFAGNELYLEEDATAHRNLAIAFSPDGSRVALGGFANTVHVYEITER